MKEEWALLFYTFLRPPGFQDRAEDCRSSWTRNSQSHREVSHTADHTPSSQSSHSLSSFQGKAESQGPSGPDLGLVPRFFRCGCRISEVSWAWLRTSYNSQDRKWSGPGNRAAQGGGRVGKRLFFFFFRGKVGVGVGERPCVPSWTIIPLHRLPECDLDCRDPMDNFIFVDFPILFQKWAM